MIAIWDEDDQWHGPAVIVYREMLRDNARFYCSAPVLLECGNAASRKPYRASVDHLRLVLESGSRLVHPTVDDWRTAWAAYRRGEAGSAGIVDHLSFVVMRRLSIARVFTNDKHFAAAGFDVMF